MKEFLKRLIRAESTLQRGEIEVAKVVAARFAQAGITAVVDTWDGQRANVTAHIKGGRNAGALFLVCHLDVVPAEGSWAYPPFEAVETDGKIFGRGATDMKGGLASAVTAICEIVESRTKLRGDIVFAATAGEETDGAGVARFVKNSAALPKPVGVILPEPTGFDVVTAHRGLVWLRITTKGKAAHSSTPQLGVNAIYSMKKVLDELERYKPHAKPHPLLGGCSVSVNMIHGGEVPNMVPDRCTISVDIRIVPGQEPAAIAREVQGILDKLKAADPQFDADLSTARQCGGLETDNECDFVKRFCSAVGAEGTQAVGFTTDGPNLVPLGAPILIFGPGDTKLCHKPDEYIEIADLEKAVAHYRNAILEFLG